MKLRNVLLGLTATIAMYSCSGSNLPVQAAATPVTVEKAAIPAIFASTAIVPGTNIDLSATGLNVVNKTLTIVGGTTTAILANLINTADGGKVYFSVTGKGSVSSAVISDGSSVNYTAPGVGEFSRINVFFLDNGNTNVVMIDVNSTVAPPPPPLNLPPQVDVFTATPALGNNPLNVVFNMAVSDPTLPADTLTCTLDYGDGSAVYTGPCVATKAHTYAVGNYNAKLTVSDGVNAPVSKVIVVTVNANVAPVINLFTATPAVGSGSLATVFAVNVSDATTNPADTLTCTVDYGDGSSYGPAACLASLNHTYAAPGTYTAKLTLSDGVNAPVTKSITVLVNNVVSIVNFTATTTPPTLNVAFAFDPTTFTGGTAPYTCVINFDTTNAIDPILYPGFVKTQTISPCTSPIGLINKTYPFAGKFIANLKVTDSVGSTANKDVTINMNFTNNNPIIQTFTATPNPFTLTSVFANGNADVENAFATLSYSSQTVTVKTKATDLDVGDLITCKVNGVLISTCDDNTMTATINTPGSKPYTFDVADNFGGTATSTINVVAKSAPASLLTTAPLASGRKALIKVNAADGDGDNLSCTLTFGDGFNLAFGGCQDVMPSSYNHTYAAAGSYTVTFSVTDGTNTVTKTSSVTVVN